MVLPTLTGSAQGENEGTYLHNLQTGGRVSLHVSDKLKNDILLNKFVELHQLLPGHEDKANMSGISVENLDSGGISVFKAEPKQDKKDLSVDDWTNAFIVFIDVVADQRPTEIPQLLSYMRTVRAIGLKNGFKAMNQYDRGFRHMKASSAHSWGMIEPNLYLETMNETVARKLQVMQGGRVARANVCFKYQTGMCPRSRESCVYDHKCERCGGRHPSQVCNVNRGRMTPSATVSSGHLNAPRFGQPAGQGVASVMQNSVSQSHVQSFRSPRPSSSRFKFIRKDANTNR